MPVSKDFIQVSHAGSLPRTPELIAAYAARENGHETTAFNQKLSTAVADLVQRQKAIGITIPGDGEFGKSMSSTVDYGAWWSYSFQRTSGLELDHDASWLLSDVQSVADDVKITGFLNRRDRVTFSDAYNDPDSGIFTSNQNAEPKPFPKVVGPISYIGHDAIAQDTTNLRRALDAAGVTDGFITSIAPGSAMRIGNDHYRTDEELVYAWADVMREEYKAIIDAGLILQIDDPSLAENWDQITPEPSVSDYLRFSQIRIEALNHALRDLPEDRIRYHLCWGSWHGPHTTDLEFTHIVDLMLQVRASGFTFEAANVRHEHEYTVWDNVKLPEGKYIIPGVVSHATNVVEHPELVAQRIERFAERVGRENVVASTDCGLGGRIHADIAFAKLESLARGAEIASARLWK
jgi:5-methyltetrahydropteroyltriglutamate--homocysteine methyltransferase